MRLPDSAAEGLRWTVLVVALALLAIVAVYAVNALLSVGVFLVLLVVTGLLLWVVFGRLWDWARHGKPLLRGGWRSGGEMDGD
jgi:hypothetical protein